MIKFIITCFYIGLVKPAPGTWGSLFGVALFVPIHLFGGSLLLVTLIPTIFFFVIIVLTGLAINTGQSEKFIYFQF